MKTIGKKIYADKGKSLYRREDGSGPFKCVSLGFGIFNNGSLRSEKAEDYEERKDDNNG